MAWNFAVDIKTEAVEEWAAGRTPRKSQQSAGALQVGRSGGRDMDTVYSYEIPIAVRLVGMDGRPWFLLNGDASGQATGRHQTEVRHIVDRQTGALKLGTKGRCIVPFSALTAAGIAFSRILLLDTTGDLSLPYTVSREIKGRYVTEDGQETTGWQSGVRYLEYETPRVEEHTYERHVLGNSLFRVRRTVEDFVPDATGDVTKYTRYGEVVKGRYDSRVEIEYYVSGVDDTASPGRGIGYFLTRLKLAPGSRAPRTVAQAFRQLKPLKVRRAENAGIEVRRQGDQFFIPWDAATLSARAKRPVGAKGHGDALPNTAGEPSRHVASTSYPVEGGTAVTGVVRHTNGDHSPVYCYGRWYLAVPNYQDRSWGATGRID